MNRLHVERTVPPPRIPIRVLIVEDAADDAELAISALTEHGYAPVWDRVETEKDYLARLVDAPDVILADYRLPQFSGLQALQLLKERGLDIPFIVVSGTISDVQAANLIKAGASDFLLKDRLARLGSAVQQTLDQKLARDEQRRLETALQESEEKHRLICETTTDAVIVLDAGNRIQYANPAIRDIFGYVPEEVVGKDLASLQPERFREQHRRALNRYLDSGVKTREWGPVERTGLHRDGREVPLEITYSQAMRAGKTTFIGFIRDTTARKNAEEKITRLNRVYAVLSGINSLIVRVHERRELFNEACRIAVENGQFPFAWIGVFDPATQDVTPIAWAGEHSEGLIRARSSSRDDTPAGKGAVGQAIRERRPVFNNDLIARSFGGPRVKEILRLGFRSQITLPLFEEQTVVGTLTMYAAEPNFFDEEELKLLTELAGDISFALENISRQQKLEKLARIRAVSSEINAAIVRIHEREALLRETCRIATEHGKFEMVWVALLDAGKQEVRPVSWEGFSPEAAHAVTWANIIAVRGTLGEAISSRRAAIRNDIGAELPVGRLLPEALARGCHSATCLPFVVNDEVVAAINLFAAERGFFDDEELALLNEVAADVSFALQAIEKQETLDYLSYYDGLTGLANATLFQERLMQYLSAARHAQNKLALVLLNVQRFKIVNDSLGRHTGDELLKQIADRLMRCAADPKEVARLGADNFAVVLLEAQQEGDVARIIEQKLQTCFGEPFKAGGTELRISAQVGVAVFPTDGADAAALFRNGEAALTKAKALGERYMFYEEQMNAMAAYTLRLENKLRQALDGEQFVLHYQPKIDIASGRISGIEALIRWNDPETGLVPPLQFIPLLEETGMILQVGRWVINRALEDHRAWSAQGLPAPRIAVNVSPIQLRQKDFVDDVRHAMGAFTDGPFGLDLEITESLIMEDMEGNIAKLRAIRDLGVNIAIDDFGTGYSSLGYLAKLPVNALKVDRSFIVNMVSSADSMTIVSTIISLAHALGLKVIAEGVETEEQSKYLKLLKCDEIQGYLCSKPLPANELILLLKQGRSATPI